MIERVIRLTLRIATDPDADAEELAGLAVDLRGLLLELDIESADRLTRGQVLPGTRSGEMFVAGALTVILVGPRSFSPSLSRPCSGGCPSPLVAALNSSSMVTN